MCPDAATPLVAAAKQRHELTRARAIQAIRELDRAGSAVTFTAVAGQARVSRSWLYSQPDICRQIQQLRTVLAHPCQIRPQTTRRRSAQSLEIGFITT